MKQKEIEKLIDYLEEALDDEVMLNHDPGVYFIFEKDMKYIIEILRKQK